MEVKFGLISADSHVVLDQDAFTSRMSSDKWGELIPQVVESDGPGSPELWTVHGRRSGGGRGVANCPAVMKSTVRASHPKRWEEVPPEAYVPAERLHALDEDGVDAEVLFPNDPAHYFCQYNDPEFDLACVQAYNDATGAWTEVSDRYIPLIMIPYSNSIDVIVKEVARAVSLGHRGLNMMGRISEVKGIPDFTDPFWDPLWASCQDFDIPVNLHHTAGMNFEETLLIPRWEGSSEAAHHACFATPTCMGGPQMIPDLIFSGVTERFPRIRWILAENGVGSINYAIDACSHEWERLHLWTEGLLTPPWEVVQRQVFANFWYEDFGLNIQDRIGPNNLMWESDFPHVASTYPHSWKFLDEETGINKLSEPDRHKILFENAIRVYGLNATVSPDMAPPTTTGVS